MVRADLPAPNLPSPVRRERSWTDQTTMSLQCRKMSKKQKKKRL